MRYSHLFGKTTKSVSKDVKATSHRLLVQGGFIRQIAAGRYAFLPLGYRVWEKIMNIIEKEMAAIGSQRMSTPILHPIEIWQATNRDTAFGDEMYLVEDHHGSTFAIGATAEGLMTELVKSFQPSYKDLPYYIHQFAGKFRDEKRPRGGLLRVREFVMKDAYSFDKSEKDLKITYQKFYEAYLKIAEQLGLKVSPVLAHSGAIGGDYNHEFIVESEMGEGEAFLCDKCDYAAHKERAEFTREEVNRDEVVKDMEIVPLEWEKATTIKSMVAHYGKPANNMIKTVVFKSTDGRLVLGVMTGDLEVSEVKLAKAVGESHLEKATSKDLDSIGAIAGAVHAWGYEDHKDRITFVADYSIVKAKNLIGGFKTQDTDPINVNYGRDFKADVESDISEAYEGSKCPNCKAGTLKKIRGIEWGHCFKLDQFYSKPHNACFTDKDGTDKPFWMGSYGIGLGRSISTIVEMHNDKNGIVWPETVSPFQVHLQGLNLDDKSVKKKAEETYQVLLKEGIEVLYDDRENVSAGEKFADADLIGIPWRVVISQKTGPQLEMKRRNEVKAKMVDLKTLVDKVEGK